MTAAAPAAAERRAVLHWAPLLTLVVMLGPVAAGLAGTLAPAFGYLPALGGEALSLDPWRELFAWPGIGAAVRLSLTTGLAATFLSLVIVVAISAAWQGTRTFRVIQAALSPLLSVPHAAAAFGLAFLIAPSGWIVRALSPWATGWHQPPDVLVIHDPAGLALIAGLVVKEVPFLLLMTLAALGQADAERSRLVAQALGYGRVAAWVKVVLPRVYPQIRLPVYAVLAFSMSVVDVALILGPDLPPPLAVQVLAWMHDPDLALRFRAAAGAVLQLLLVLGALGFWRLGELAAAWLGRRWAEAGARWAEDTATRSAALLLAALVAGSVILGLAGLGVWSLAGFWGFPHVLPDQLSLHIWQRAAGSLAGLAATTALIAAGAAAIAVWLTVACLESEQRHGTRPTTRSLWLLYLPLMAPQIAFLTGVQALMIAAGLDGGPLAVVFAHLVFVLPYVFLSLADPFRALDPRYGVVAGALGARPGRVLWAVRLPMLLRPLLVAGAVGLAVSVGQYLPTVLVGAGRVATLTTEAVALASGGDRRLIGAYALVQMALPFLAFTVALAVPWLAFHHRRALGSAA